MCVRYLRCLVWLMHCCVFAIIMICLVESVTDGTTNFPAYVLGILSGCVFVLVEDLVSLVELYL